MTAAEAALRADPALVETWVHGWTLTRGTAPPVRDGEALRVDVGWPDQRLRYVYARGSSEVAQRAASIVEPWCFLKVCEAPERVMPGLPPGWVLRPPGFMMRCDGPMAGSGRLPSGYALELTGGRSVVVARIIAADGREAAIGRVACVGDCAIYDRISTEPDHRRRGLARALLLALEAAAREKGGRRGVLVATTDGRALYETLGWHLHSLYTTAVIPGPPGS
ncbi:GNAT family N-acetyltransferase [Stigmatella sp. ncwal1]|uniref:GNAT family N-acetyltransferase n=1 Tax=Stigmatella ashevillensis TaxID=2995309 RepID=A0ABT5D7V0_9BACT|nr:GNAT family N-acetyltransferase [Stigmatella ashevillena]MDC0709732.1 GNAT family N-acetyltransferase [Stigmatella ashevillena]